MMGRPGQPQAVSAVETPGARRRRLLSPRSASHVCAADNLIYKVMMHAIATQVVVSTFCQELPMRPASMKISSVMTASLALTMLAQAADITKPNIKPGLWEVTSSPQTSGDMPISDEQLAKLPPEQRARIQAAMQASLAAGNKPHVYKECMTPEKIARNFEIDKGEDSSCKRKVVASSASELQLHDDCEKPERKTVSDVHFHFKGGTQMSGRINVVTSANGKTMTVNSTIEGKWLGADCGSVKDAEEQK